MVRCLILILVSASSLSSITPCRAQELAIEPELVYLGEFSSVDMFDSSPVTTPIRATIQCPQPWRLTLSLSGPFRRESDDHALPLARVAELWPAIPSSVLDGQPYVVAEGRGGDQPEEAEFDPYKLLDGMQTYLRIEDPPGLYRTVVLARIEDPSGALLVGPTPVPFQFDLLPWMRFDWIPEEMEVDVAMSDPGMSSSEPYSLFFRSNSASRTMPACSSA